jgi:fructokinase
MMLRIGIDLGGTKIEGIALDGHTEVARLRVSTPRGDYAQTLEAIGSLVELLERDTSGATVGVGIPGTLDPGTGLVKNANSVWLIAKPLLQDLEQRLGRSVRIENDANCFAISEAADGAAAGRDVVFGVIAGTGVGGGIVVGGRVLTGPNGVAGEWGHNPLPWAGDDEVPGPSCYCGRRGCIETFLSGPALEREMAVPTKAIVAMAGAGDAIADAALCRYERRMARALAAVINILDPDVIVLGGGMSNIDRLYATVPSLWNEWVFGAGGDREVRTSLVRSAHGDSSGVRGAAWLWPLQ